MVFDLPPAPVEHFPLRVSTSSLRVGVGGWFPLGRWVFSAAGGVSFTRCTEQWVGEEIDRRPSTPAASSRKGAWSTGCRSGCRPSAVSSTSYVPMDETRQTVPTFDLSGVSVSGGVPCGSEDHQTSARRRDRLDVLSLSLPPGRTPSRGNGAAPAAPDHPTRLPQSIRPRPRDNARQGAPQCGTVPAGSGGRPARIAMQSRTAAARRPGAESGLRWNLQRLPLRGILGKDHDGIVSHRPSRTVVHRPGQLGRPCST